MTPLIMVMGFADSMQMVSAIRIRLREGDSKLEAVRFAINVVGPACVLAHGAALLSFLALLFSELGPHPHLRRSRRHGRLHFVRRGHHRAAAPGAAVHPQREDAGARPHARPTA